MNGSPPFLASIRDTFQVARFELIRAVRTWQALAVIVLYVVATAGSVRIFVALIAELENVVADALRVPRTTYPGTLIDRLVSEDGELRGVIAGMVGDESLVDSVLGWPILSIFHLWLGLLLAPYLASFTAAECISVDLRSRALRFEVLRTGRLELVIGRYLGQAVLTWIASLASVSATWTVGMLYMVGHDPFDLAVSTTWLALRAWAFGLPFVGLGVLCSQLTSSPAWARVLTVSATSVTWVAYGIGGWAAIHGYGPVADALFQVLPQGWIRPLWEPGSTWLVSATFHAALGTTFCAIGWLRFSRMDL